MATFIFRLILVAAGLVFAVGLSFAFAVLLAAWLLRAAWAKLTGKPVNPFVMRMHPRSGFESMMKRAGEPSRTPRADAVVAPRRSIGEVVDVEPK